MYTAIVLDEESHQKLVRKFIHLIPKEWKIYAHHMTINLGPIEKGPVEKSLLNTEAMLTVTSIAGDNLVMAVGVETVIPSANKIKHITLAVNLNAGGKPFLSNKLANWAYVDNFDLWGKITEVS